MKLGLSSFAFAWAIGVPGRMPTHPMRALDLLAEARRLGTRVLQVADNLPLLRLPETELATFEQEAAAAGISLEVGMRGLHPDTVRAHLELARRLGSPFLRVVVDSAGDEPTPDEVVHRLRGLMPDIRRTGVRIAVENHDRFPSRTLASIVERAGPEHVGICLDTVNSFGALEGPGVVVPCLVPYTLNLHLKDFTVARVDSAMGFTVTGAPAGEGRLDVPWLLDCLRTAGRDVNAILETWPPFGPTLDDTVARERAWAETSVHRLRRLIPD